MLPGAVWTCRRLTCEAQWPEKNRGRRGKTQVLPRCVHHEAVREPDRAIPPVDLVRWVKRGEQTDTEALTHTFS
jgi:hypothetical protein